MLFARPTAPPSCSSIKCAPRPLTASHRATPRPSGDSGQRAPVARRDVSSSRVGGWASRPLSQVESTRPGRGGLKRVDSRCAPRLLGAPGGQASEQLLVRSNIDHHRAPSVQHGDNGLGPSRCPLPTRAANSWPPAGRSCSRPRPAEHQRPQAIIAGQIAAKARKWCKRPGKRPGKRQGGRAPIQLYRTGERMRQSGRAPAQASRHYRCYACNHAERATIKPSQRLGKHLHDFQAPVTSYSLKWRLQFDHSISPLCCRGGGGGGGVGERIERSRKSRLPFRLY